MTTVSDNEAANAAAPDADPQTIEPAPMHMPGSVLYQRPGAPMTHRQHRR
ncbi:hypothetical protein GS445_07710 [Rhodococcus hoagii]|nr:hypothetical protein [Prescottella equi]